MSATAGPRTSACRETSRSSSTSRVTPREGPGRNSRNREAHRPMSVSDAPRLDLAELGRLLRAADPAALLVPARLLRRVIKRDRKLTGLGLQVPHHKSYVLGRET